MSGATAAQMVLDANTVTTIISNINSLYTNAFSQLITYSLGILAFVGIFVPGLISFWQNRKFKSDHAELVNKIETEISSLGQQLDEKLDQRIVQKTGDFRDELSEIRQEILKELDRAESGLEGKSHYAQAMKHKDEGSYVVAARDFAYAGHQFAQAKQEANMRKCISQLIDEVLPKLNGSDWNKFEDIAKECETFLENIKLMNDNSRYDDDIRNFKLRIKESKERQ